MKYLHIVGAPRCGSTFLYNNLTRDKRFNFGFVKEKNFFFRNDKKFRKKNKNLSKRGVFSESEFNKLNNDENRFFSDASVLYLSQPNIAKRIKNYFGDSKIIIIVRNPAERSFSHYCRDLNDPVKDLRTSFVNSLKKEKVIDEYEFGKSYIRLSSYSNDIKRFKKVFGEENVLVLFFSEIRTWHLKISQFLKIELNEFNYETKINQSGLSKNKKIFKLFDGMHRFKAFIKRISPHFFLGILIFLVSKYRDFTTTKIKLTRVELKKINNLFFREDILNLSKMGYSKQINNWL